jgi:hypothetical protein
MGLRFLIATAPIALSLGAGMAGYAYFEQQSWLDAFLNAAMLLGGEGPITVPKSEGGKLFAGFYALYAGLLLVALAGYLLAPVVRHVLHRFHWEE